MFTKFVKTVSSSQKPVLKIQSGRGSNPNYSLLRVRKTLQPDQNQSALKMLKKFRIINPNQYVLKVK